MSKDVFESLTNGTGLQTKLTGIPSSDNTVSNYIPPRDCLSALMCHDGTTSKTILSYDSKFNTTADQTTKYKDTTTNLPYENVPTSPKQIKSDNEKPLHNYHDRYRTSKNFPPPYQNDSATTSHPVIYGKCIATNRNNNATERFMERLRSNGNNREPPEPSMICDNSMTSPRHKDTGRVKDAPSLPPVVTLKPSKKPPDKDIISKLLMPRKVPAQFLNSSDPLYKRQHLLHNHLQHINNPDTKKELKKRVTFKVEPTNCKTYASIARTDLTDSAPKQPTFNECADVPPDPDPIEPSTTPDTPPNLSGLKHSVSYSIGDIVTCEEDIIVDSPDLVMSLMTGDHAFIWRGGETWKYAKCKEVDEECNVVFIASEEPYRKYKIPPDKLVKYIAFPRTTKNMMKQPPPIEVPLADVTCDSIETMPHMDSDGHDSPSMKKPPPLELLRVDINRDPIEDNTMKQPPPLETPRVDLVHDPIEAKVNNNMPPAHHKLTDGPMI